METLSTELRRQLERTVVEARDVAAAGARRKRGALQEEAVRGEVCRVMEGGREAFSRRWARLGREI